jgi:hypothetical protein
VTRSLWKSKQRYEAFVELIYSDGASPAGQLPPRAYADALADAPLGRASEVVDAHRESAGAPNFSGGGGV